MALTLMKGSEAIAEAAIRAGARFFFCYPITPQTEIPEYMSARMPEIGGCFQMCIRDRDNADQSSAARVDDALQCLPQLCLCVGGHTLQLCLQVLPHDLVEAAPEDIGLPQLAGVALKFLQKIVHHFLGLLLVAHDGGNRRLDVRPYQMDGRRAGEMCIRDRALGAKVQGKDTKVFTLLGDGECQEGQIWEALMSAAHYKLDNLTVIVDNNGLQIDGTNNEVMLSLIHI